MLLRALVPGVGPRRTFSTRLRDANFGVVERGHTPTCWLRGKHRQQDGAFEFLFLSVSTCVTVGWNILVREAKRTNKILIPRLYSLHAHGSSCSPCPASNQHQTTQFDFNPRPICIPVIFPYSYHSFHCPSPKHKRCPTRRQHLKSRMSILHPRPLQMASRGPRMGRLNQPLLVKLASTQLISPKYRMHPRDSMVDADC